MRQRAAAGAHPAARRLGLALAVLVAWPLAARALPAFEAVRAAHRPSDRLLVDRHGVPLQTLRVDADVRRLGWVPLEDLSPALRHAIVLSEDQRFYEHAGVDWGAVARSAWANLWNTRTRGASTLTMQLAGLLDEDLARPGGGRSLGQKLDQAWTARRLEARWTKAQILEAYLNRVAFRGELVGIAALSQTLFGKWPSGLDAQEAAIAAALLRGPNAAPATVAQRACGVLQRQRAACTGVAALTEAALARRPGMPLGEQLAPHAARQVLAAWKARGEPGAPSAPWRTTLDAALQRLAIETLRARLSELGGRQVEDGAVLVLDNRSGEVRAWVGSSGDLSGAREVDGVLARRQPGSTLKPFVYGLAFERRLITPASLLDDAPAELATRSGVYAPQNYDRDFKGWVSARTALGASLNVPAVRVAAMLPPDALFNRLQAHGLALAESGGYHGHALALGGADTTLAALTNAYRVLANGGRYTPLAALAPAFAPAGPGPAPRRVADPAVAWLVGDILADNGARVRTFGLDSALATRGWAAVKTGTSKDLRDNWCIGYTDRYTVGVWVGNASGAPMHGVSGVSGAAPVWRTLVEALHADRPSQPPPRPPGIVARTLRYEPAGAGARTASVPEAPRPEVFLAGTEQAQWQPGAQVDGTGAGAARFGIVHPRDGSLFALDPDIPPAAQRIRFEGEAGTWRLDGRTLGQGARVAWAPWPGRHALSLVGRDGRVIQTVRFEVRGAGLRAGAPGAPALPKAAGRGARDGR
ncbi:penicillin-binding protein 1C [Piscinibacter sakaiensis]|uniref:peptidoglycan glycosyltransferase n=1 Tax=Piscinibacter sakaiensis TaxID=1547922 RepID=A0A0K8P834_PISS1|nr:penicillin-binding protein 1C [Piscinibacter sakaiensis]GAP38797.1 multimodular transpeptidase-transglycosylase [Piscinibacter sakaiensis]